MKRRILSIVLMLGWLLVTANQNYACPPQNQDPIASLTAIPERPPLDINVMLDGSASTDPDGYIREYQWDFNYGGSFDANYYETSSYHPDGAFDGITKHPYGSTGVYTVMLMVTDNEYATDTDTCKVYLGSVFNVTRDTVHNTIQAGIDDANDGDLIRVYPGMYGAVDFNDCDDQYDRFYERPMHRPVNDPEDGSMWNQLQEDLFNLEPLTDDEIAEYAEYAAYKE